MTMEWLQRTLSVRPNTMNNAETPTASQKLCIFLLAKNNCLHYMKKIKSNNSSALIFLTLFFLSFSAFTASAQKITFEAEPLAAEEAFLMDYIVSGPSEAVIRWQIPKFYYLYKDKFAFSSNDFIIEDVHFPPAETKNDPYFGLSEVYYDVVEATLRLTPKSKKKITGIVDVTYQGCWEGGICYPLLKTSLTLSGL